MDALEKLEFPSAIALQDCYASLVIGNLPHASVTRYTYSNHEPIVNFKEMNIFFKFKLAHIAKVKVNFTQAAKRGKMPGTNTRPNYLNKWRKSFFSQSANEVQKQYQTLKLPKASINIHLYLMYEHGPWEEKRNVRG